MQSQLKYRIIALTLVVIFAAFNIGLPIAVASCPMMEMTQGAACCSVNDGGSDGVARISNAVDTSCCQTKFATDRNRTEFLQTQLKTLDTTKLFVHVVSIVEFQYAIHNLPSAFINSASPPRAVDIPILVSSLLI